VSGLSGTVYRLYDENGMGVKGSYMDEEFKKTEWENRIFYNEKSLPDSIHSSGYRKSKSYYKYAADGSYTIIEVEGLLRDTSFYDKDNKIKEQRGSDGSITKYEYNAKRQLIKSINTDESGASVTTYVYNAAGKLLSKKTTGSSTGSAVYSYDNKGLLIKEVNDYGSGSKMVTNYFYKFR
jgi:YD repeat-containing protein